MTIKQIQITLAALFLIFGTAVAGAKELIIDSAFTESSLGPYLSYHLDTTDALTIDQISSEDRGVRFRPLSSDNPSLGYMIHPLWVALTVINRKNAPERAILEYNYPIIDDVTLFIPQKNGFIEKKGGDHYPASIKEIPYRTIAFPVTIDPGKLTCYLKIKTSGSMTVALKLYVREQFRNMQVIEMTLLGLFYGLMISLIMYNILIFFAMKEISFLYLSLFSLFLSLYSCVHTGIAFQYLWPSHVTFANASHPMFLIFTISMAIQFTRSYLDTGNSLPSIDPFLRVTMLFGLAAGFLSLVIKYHIMTQFSTLYSLIGIVVVLILGSVLFFRGKREAVFYLIAWIFIFIGGILSAGRAFGVIPETPISNWTYQIGSPILIMLLSLGVSDKLNTMKRALDRALAALKESEEKYKTVVDNAHDGILVIIDEKPIYANKNLVAMLGYDEKTIRSRYFYDLFPETPTGKELVIRMYKERMVGRDVPSRYESQMLTADGTIIDTMIAAAHAVINGKKGSICLISDITEQKKSQKIIMEQFEKIQVQYNRLEELNSELTATHEQLIQANESITIEKEQLAATLSSIGDAVIVYNAEGIITMVNPNAAVLTGWAIEEAVGKKAGDVVMLTDSHARKLIFEDYPRQYDPRGLDTIGIPFDMRDRNGSEKIIEINGTHIRKEHSQTGGVVLAIRDITGKVRLEKEILNMSKMESLGVLAGGIAHDFNNLLTAILGNVSMARSLGSLEGRIAELFDKIEQAV
nr:7TM diverse intracellular signaling domain-containing protein [Spirochaetota bacterium]